MTLLLHPDHLQRRRHAASASLAPLTASLAAELHGLAVELPEMPRQKALLSREGGRCPADGSLLEFDPRQSAEHRCSSCGRVFGGEHHRRMWIMWQHLWLAERCVIGATLHVLTENTEGALVARHVLAQASERYLELPNRDNVLGPSRPFFSTYLESIWLLQLSVAVDLLEMTGAPDPLMLQVRDRVIEPSAALIASFDEGRSNRQVWNAAALLAAGAVLRRDDLVELAVNGRSGLHFHLENGLLADGTWYEGENYHLFAHRGLWYAISICQALAIPLPPSLLARFHEAFATPLLTALPDLTFPSRRDSQYAVSLRQWRFAESLELGLARQADDRLAAGLHTLYTYPGERRDTGRWSSTAEAERNGPPTALTRADLGWKSLLCAREELPAAPESYADRSVLLESQGFAVLRPASGVYASLDYGEPGGGHGHPDRLGLILAVGDDRWLDDPGTGSYVDPSLFWYRSTLAHNAPLVDGVSQRPTRGRLCAFEAGPEAAWVEAELPAEATSGVRFRRTLVAHREYLLDVLSWEDGEGHVVDLPFHVHYDAARSLDWTPADLHAAEYSGGSTFLRDVQTATGDAKPLLLDSRCMRGHAAMYVHLPGGGEAIWWRARHPGAPRSPDGALLALRTSAARGTLASVWSWVAPVDQLAWWGDAIIVGLASRPVHRVARQTGGDLRISTSRGELKLGGVRPAPATSAPPTHGGSALPPPIALSSSQVCVRELAEESYRRSEESWHEAGQPRARIAMHIEPPDLRIDLDVCKHPVIFHSRDDDPALDNEHPDIHGDGVQLHVQPAGADQQVAWLLVPEPGTSAVRVRRTGAGAIPDPACSWRMLPNGYAMTVRLPLAALAPPAHAPRRFALDVLVNEIGEGRVRRRGQLVLSGGAGEYVYLRGARQPGERLLLFELADA